MKTVESNHGGDAHAAGQLCDHAAGTGEAEQGGGYADLQGEAGFGGERTVLFVLLEEDELAEGKAARGGDG